jgi:hypothetical protein
MYSSVLIVQIKDLPSLCSLNMKMIRYPTDLLWKYCSCCGEYKPNYMFSDSKSCINNRSSKCKECLAVYSKCHAQTYKKRKMELITKRRRRQKKKAISYMGGKCQDCYGIFQDCVYDFHHLDPTQKEIRPTAALNKSWEEAVKELDKCTLLCSNCHRIRHYGERT